MTPDELRARLREAGKRFAAADQARTAARRDIAEAVRAGHDGRLLTVSEMAELAGVSRVTAHHLLKGGS